MPRGEPCRCPVLKAGGARLRGSARPRRLRACRRTAPAPVAARASRARNRPSQERACRYPRVHSASSLPPCAGASTAGSIPVRGARAGGSLGRAKSFRALTGISPVSAARVRGERRRATRRRPGHRWSACRSAGCGRLRPPSRTREARNVGPFAAGEIPVRNGERNPLTRAGSGGVWRNTRVHDAGWLGMPPTWGKTTRTLPAPCSCASRSSTSGPKTRRKTGCWTRLTDFC